MADNVNASIAISMIVILAITIGSIRYGGGPGVFRDMWECRERPIKRWRERR